MLRLPAPETQGLLGGLGRGSAQKGATKRCRRICPVHRFRDPAGIYLRTPAESSKDRGTKERVGKNNSEIAADTVCVKAPSFKWRLTTANTEVEIEHIEKAEAARYEKE